MLKYLQEQNNKLQTSIKNLHIRNQILENKCNDNKIAMDRVFTEKEKHIIDFNQAIRSGKPIPFFPIHSDHYDILN